MQGINCTHWHPRSPGGGRLTNCGWCDLRTAPTGGTQDGPFYKPTHVLCEKVCKHRMPADKKAGVYIEVTVGKMHVSSVLPPAGDAVALVLKKLGFRENETCGCKHVRSLMNEWGYRECLRQRKFLLAWFATKAKEKGMNVSNRALWAFIVSALWELRRTRRTRKEQTDGGE